MLVVLVVRFPSLSFCSMVNDGQFVPAFLSAVDRLTQASDVGTPGLTVRLAEAPSEKPLGALAKKL